MKLKTKIAAVFCLTASVLFWGQGVQAEQLDTNRLVPMTNQEDFTFETVETETESYVCVVGYQDKDAVLEDGSDRDKTVVVPDTYDGKPVTQIKGAFQNNTVVETIVLPDSLKVIGEQSFFGCTSLHTVYTYDAQKPLTEQDVVQLQQESYSAKFLKEGEQYFALNGLQSGVRIPVSLTTYTPMAFDKCCFKVFDVPEENAYFTGSKEGVVHFNETVGPCLLSADGTYLYQLAPSFWGLDDANPSYQIPDTVTTIGDYAISHCAIQWVAVPDSVESIKTYAFASCNNLLSVTFTDNSKLTSVGEYAFAYNDNLDIILPLSVKTIGSYCFAYINNRTPDISKTQIVHLPAKVFYGCPNLHTITMPATLLTIAEYAFAGNTNLNQIIFLGTTLDKIGNSAFQDCTNLHNITVPEGVKEIEPNTFSGCTNLNTVKLPESLEKIESEAFAACQNMHQINIPKNVTSIAKDSFSGVASSSIDTSKNKYAQNFLSGKVLAKKGQKVKKGNLWYKVTKAGAKNGTVTLTKVSSKSIKTAKIPSTITITGYRYKVTAISANAFSGCKKLKSVTIGSNVKKIGSKAFKNCKKLGKITIKTKKLTKKSIGSSAFKNTAKKVVVKVPKTKKKAYKSILRKKGLSKKAKYK